MSSTFTWLDYSEQERRKMLDVIELFGERTTRDELGLGGIRDGFADLLFPGTSTIQTRAKYFLFVPWIYQTLEAKSTPSATIGVKARALEIRLIDALSQSKDKDTAGLIGKQAKENLQRLPSSVYWQGLMVWGIRRFRGSQEEYHRSLDLFYHRRNAHGNSRRDYEGEALGESGPTNWHTGLPPVPDDFPHVAAFALDHHEADYLRERILGHCSKSLLAFLVRERIAVDKVGFAWELPGTLPSQLREQLEHGWNFSLAVHGAQLLYNLMLAELQKTEERIEHYRTRMSQWWDAVSGRVSALRSWVRTEFWTIVSHGNPRVSLRAKRFVNEWIDAVQTATQLAQVRDSQPLRHLIEIREVQLKGGLARLKNQRALELWPGAAGDGQLDLRWRSAKGIAADIIRGVEGAAGA